MGYNEYYEVYLNELVPNSNQFNNNNNNNYNQNNRSAPNNRRY